jgi:hypothetical protein
MIHWVYDRVKPVFIEPETEYDQEWIEDHEGPLVWVFLGMKDANRSQQVYNMMKSNEQIFKKSVHSSNLRPSKKKVLCWDANKICETLAIAKKFVHWTDVPQIKGERGPRHERMNFAYWKKKDPEVTEETFLKWVDNFIQKQLSPQFMSQDIPYTELVKPTDVTKSLTWNHMNQLFQLAHDKLILFYDGKDRDSKHVKFLPLA